MSDAVLLATGDAHVQSYVRSFDVLEIDLVLWNEVRRVVRAEGVQELRDIGTWECDGIARFSPLDSGERLGYAVVDTDGRATLQFNATRLVL
jgi:hypothetical protein